MFFFSPSLYLSSCLASTRSACNIFNHCCCVLLLFSQFVLILFLSSLMVDDEGMEVGSGAGTGGQNEPRSRPPFHLSTSGFQARRLKSQLGDPRSFCEQKQRNLNVKSYLFFSCWVHLFTSGCFSTCNYMRLLSFQQRWLIKINDKHLQGLLTQPWGCAICVERLPEQFPDNFLFPIPPTHTHLCFNSVVSCSISLKQKSSSNISAWLFY